MLVSSTMVLLLFLWQVTQICHAACKLDDYGLKCLQTVSQNKHFLLRAMSVKYCISAMREVTNADFGTHSEVHAAILPGHMEQKSYGNVLKEEFVKF